MAKKLSAFLIAACLLVSSLIVSLDAVPLQGFGPSNWYLKPIKRAQRARPWPVPLMLTPRMTIVPDLKPNGEAETRVTDSANLTPEAEVDEKQSANKCNCPGCMQRMMRRQTNPATSNKARFLGFGGYPGYDYGYGGYDVYDYDYDYYDYPNYGMGYPGGMGMGMGMGGYGMGGYGGMGGYW